MTSFVRRFSLSSSPPNESPISTTRRKSSTSNSRILGARDYKLANLTRTSPSPSSPPHQNISAAARRSSEVTLTNDMHADGDAERRRSVRILGARDYQQAISADERKRRRSSVASTLVDDIGGVPMAGNAVASRAVGGVCGDGQGELEGYGDGRIYGARDYKLLGGAGASARKTSVDA